MRPACPFAPVPLFCLFADESGAHGDASPEGLRERRGIVIGSAG